MEMVVQVVVFLCQVVTAGVGLALVSGGVLIAFGSLFCGDREGMK